MDKDINDAFEDIFLIEDRLNQQAYEEGFAKGKLEGNPEGYHLGYHRGAELGAELGYYLGVAKGLDKSNEKIRGQIENLIKLIENFPKCNDENFDILGQADVVRGAYKKVCSLLKIDGKFPENTKLSF